MRLKNSKWPFAKPVFGGVLWGASCGMLAVAGPGKPQPPLLYTELAILILAFFTNKMGILLLNSQGGY